MDVAEIPLVIVEGERAVLHLVEASLPVAELPGRLALYLEPGGVPGRRLVWISADGPRPLDPDRTVGEQVPPEAEIEIRLDGITELARPLHPSPFPPKGSPRRP